MKGGYKEKMDMRSRNQYLATLIPRYFKADRKGKTSFLNEYCLNTGQNRKYVIRKIQQMDFGEPKMRKKRAVQYGHEVREALWKILKIFDGPGGQHLQPLLETEVGRLRDLEELKVTGKTYQKLLSISSATIDRLLRPKKRKAWKMQHVSLCLAYSFLPSTTAIQPSPTLCRSTWCMPSAFHPLPVFFTTGSSENIFSLYEFSDNSVISKAKT